MLPSTRLSQNGRYLTQLFALMTWFWETVPGQGSLLPAGADMSFRDQENDVSQNDAEIERVIQQYDNCVISHSPPLFRFPSSEDDFNSAVGRQASR